MTDPIADMLTRIRNASAVGKSEVVLPMSKIKYGIAKILEREGLIAKTEVMGGKEGVAAGKKFEELKITLKYLRKGESAIAFIKRVSKPGLRVYVDKNNLPKVLNNMGLAIMSTPQGLMTNREARKKGVGGEVICEVY